MRVTALCIDRSCQRRTNWRFDIDPSCVEELAGALTALGFKRESLRGRLLTFQGELTLGQGPAPLQLLCVPATGRVQVRVHPIVAEPERRRAAETLYVSLLRWAASSEQAAHGAAFDTAAAPGTLHAN